MKDPRPANVFVYGTLRRGDEREHCWPCPPVLVVAAEIRAALYDLGPYPAIISGNDRVAGELWRFHDRDMHVTLAALDEVECFGQGDVDLYLRRVVPCRTGMKEVEAFTYFLADEALARSSIRVTPAADGLCRWTRST